MRNRPAPGEGKSSLGHVPLTRWEFDETVTDVFQDMLQRSIPDIGVMREAVLEVGAPFVRRGTSIVDLGCALGDSLLPFIDMFGRQCRFLGVEVAEAMLASCRKRFQSLIAEGTVEIENIDLRTRYPSHEASLTLCVLTLMFTPTEHRARILADAFNQTVPNGAFILVEKVVSSDTEVNRLFTSLYYEHKHRMGYSDEEIQRKRVSLEGVLVPLTASWNEELLRNAGFFHVECFWRSLNFAGWIAIK